MIFLLLFFYFSTSLVRPQQATQPDLTAQLDASKATENNGPELFQYKLPKKENMFILPLVYSPMYDISFYRLETLHPFDTKKWSRIARLLIDYFKKQNQLDLMFITPLRPIKNDELQLVHTKAFIRRITRSRFAVVKGKGCFARLLLFNNSNQKKTTNSNYLSFVHLCLKRPKHRLWPAFQCV